MAKSNEELVAKASIVAADLASAGKLNPKQADRFIDFIFDESILPSFARIERFTNEQLDIDKIGVGQRVAVSASEGIDPGLRRGVTHSKVTLEPKEIMLPTEISDTYKEHNLEGDGVEASILRIFARQLNNDLEELNIHGNTTGYLAAQADMIEGGSASEYVEDSYLKLYNGFLTKAQGGNVYDAGGAALSAGLFRQMLSAMPNKFKRNRNLLKWLVPVEVDELWRERVASRATAMGDQALNSAGNLTPYGIEMIPVPLMDFYPQQAQQFTLGAGATVALAFAPISAGSVVVMESAIVGGTFQPRTAYIEDTDYTIDYVNGTITNLDAGIGAGESIRVSYRSMPQILLTVRDNMIIGIGREITMERDREIFRRMNQFATTVKADVQFEELTALVLGTNINDEL
ncbi:MAG TPA: hypothetical protein VMW52_08500 [Phycisphaerae bacterium]|nr:hypothetical protein [Phycisphaerae bacterium]